MPGTQLLEGLSTGSVELVDTGGPGPVVVLLHGLLMDASLWDDVVAALVPDHRCVVPTLPLGAHRHAALPDADLSLSGQAALVGELLDRLALTDVTLVGNDTGGALVQLLLTRPGGAPRVGRAVLVSCDAFDNVPPRVTGTTLVRLGRLPAPLFGVAMQQLRLRAIRRLPIAFGWLTRRGDAATARWVQPVLHRADVRRDAVRALRAIGADRDVLVRAAERLPDVGQPMLVVWAPGDRVMPPEHGRRLAALVRHGRLVEVDDSATLVPLDQPARLADEVRAFVAERCEGGCDARAAGPADVGRPTDELRAFHSEH